MSKKMTKKLLVASTAALLSASLLSFGPVSYKVLPNSTNVASAASSVDEVKTILQGVFGKMNQHDSLSDAYDAAIDEAAGEVANLSLATDLPSFHGNLTSDQALVESSLKTIIAQVLADYKSDSSYLDAVNPLLKAELDTINGLLGTSITGSDMAAFILEVQQKAFAELSSNPLSSTNLVEQFKNVAKATIDSSWNNSSSTVIAALKSIYGSDEAALDEVKSDMDTFYTNLNARLDAEVIKEGTKALGFSYLLYEFSLTNNAITGTRSGSTYLVETFKFKGITLPLSAFEWSASTGAKGYPTSYNQDTGKVVVDLANVALPVTVLVEASVDGFKDNDGDNIVLYSQSVQLNRTSSGEGGGAGALPGAPIPAPFEEGKVLKEVTDLISSSLEIEFATNQDAAKAAAAIAAYLEKAFNVDVTSRLSTVDGVSTLTLSGSDIDPEFIKSLKKVIDEINEQTEGKLAVKPVVTFESIKSGVLDVTLRDSLIDALADNGVSGVKIKSVDASIVLPLSELNGNTKVSISSSTTAEGVQLANQQSNVVSIQVKDARGNDVYVKEQFKVSIPVNEGADVSNLTVAMIGEGSVTLIGGKYDEATKSMVFYSNIPGSYVVVENEVSFNDIANLDWAQDHIDLLAGKGIIQGKGNGVFDPTGNVTRAEFTAMIVRAFNLSLTGSSINFNDVSETAWYHDAVAAAVGYGIINGRSADAFDPSANISREEMATIAQRALSTILGYSQQPSSQILEDQFSADSGDISAVHRAGVALLANEGIIQGKGDDSFDPKGTATRAESAVILAKLFDLR